MDIFLCGKFTVYYKGELLNRKLCLNVDPTFEGEGVRYIVATSRFHVYNHRVLIKLQNYNFFCLVNFYYQFNSYLNRNLFKLFY